MTSWQMPSIGHEVIYRLATDLQNGDHYGGKRDLKQAIKLVNGMFRQRNLIILISDFLDLSEGWERYIRMLSSRSDLIGIMVRDPHDSFLPLEGLQVVVQDPAGKSQLLIDLKQYAARYEAENKAGEAYIKNVFDTAKAGFLRVDTSRDPFDQLIGYFRKRGKFMKV